jgi:hypothetical protein
MLHSSLVYSRKEMRHSIPSGGDIHTDHVLKKRVGNFRKKKRVGKGRPTFV